MLGSILSNLLLVLGSALFIGGIRFKEQKFNKNVTAVNSGLLMLATMGLLFPAALFLSGEDVSHSGLQFSRFTSGILLFMYLAFLYFQIKTHPHLYLDEESAEGDEEDEDILGFRGGLVWLAIITLFIALLSDALVSTIEETATQLNINSVFIAAIVVPIVGNAAEHTSAITFAYRDKLDLTLGISIGSSTQISLFVIPFCVLLGGVTSHSLSLYFNGYETATLFATVVTVTFLIQDGRTSWLTGLLLMCAYFIIAAGFWVHDDENLRK